MPDKKIIAKIHHRGLMKVITQRLNGDFSAYSGQPVMWQGDTDVTFTPSRERTLLPSGNDPAWDSIEGLVTGELKVKFYALPLDVMPELLSCRYSAADGVCIGENDEQTVWSGFSFGNLVKSNGVQSENKTLIYKVCYDLPTITCKTIQQGDNAVAEVELTGHAFPVFYNKSNGELGARTYDIVNSVLNQAKFEANKDCIAFPSSFTADTGSST